MCQMLLTRSCCRRAAERGVRVVNMGAEEILWGVIAGAYVALFYYRRHEERDSEGNFFAFFRGPRWLSPTLLSLFVYSMYSALFTYSHVDALSKAAMLGVGAVLALVPAIYFWFRRVTLKGDVIEAVGPFNGIKRIYLDDVVGVRSDLETRGSRWTPGSGTEVYSAERKIQIEGFLSGYKPLAQEIVDAFNAKNSNKKMHGDKRVI